MDLFKIIKTIKSFFKKDKTTSEEVSENVNNVNIEKVNALRELEDNKFEEMRIKELERAIQQSFDANNYQLSYMENKVQNIAGYLTLHNKLSYDEAFGLFERGVQICDMAPIDAPKFVNVVKYFYENFYSDEKQLEYYKYAQSISEKYDKLEKELEEKYK